MLQSNKTFSPLNVGKPEREEEKMGLTKESV
jgi:hypothetical protein